MNVTFKFIIYFDIILSECGETKTKHSSCLFDENDKHRSAMSIKGMVTCNNILTAVYKRSVFRLKAQNSDSLRASTWKKVR